MIATINKIPVYDAIITDEDTGMFKISLVDDPAVMSNFLAFDNTRKVQMYSVQDEEQRMVIGVVMRADFPIYRQSKDMGEYYVIYKADEIRKMAEKYLAESRQNDVNLMHEEGSDVDGVQMVQCFIKDSGNGIAPVGYDEIADGSLFAQFHVNNDDVWAAIKEGTYKGFSLEGVFDLVPETNKSEIEEIVESLDGAFSRLFKTKRNMSKLSRFKAALAKILVELGNVTTDKGILTWDGEEDLKAGDQVFIEDADGNRLAAEDGEYKTDDAQIIVVADGKVSEIKAAEAPVEPEPKAEEMSKVSTDKGDLKWNGEDALAAGMEVFIEKDGEDVAAEDGDYVAEDGKVIKVAEGKVAEIVEPAAEESEEEKKRKACKAARQRKAEVFSESYDEKIRKIVAAISGVFDEDVWPWVCEAADDYAIVNVWGEEGDKYYRFPLSWNEDEVSLGEKEEVKPMFVPIDAKSPWDDSKEEELKAAKERIVELEKMSAAKPAHEEVNASAQSGKTGNRGLDNLQRILAAK